MRRSTAFIFTLILLGSLATVPTGTPSTQGNLTDWSLSEAPRAGPVDQIGGNDHVLILVTGSGHTLRSLDGGDHWIPVTGLPSIGNPRIAFHPDEPSQGYLAGVGGVWRTIDHGANWDQVLTIERAARIDVSSTGHVAVGARTADGSRTVLLSTDQGGTWQDLEAPIPDHEPICGVAFGSTDQVILTMTDTQSWTTHDGGQNWMETHGAALDFIIETNGPIWRLDMGILEKTRDDGLTWDPVAYPGLATSGGPHTTSGIWLATNEGLLVTHDDGMTWEDFDHGDQVFDATSVLGDPHDEHAAFVTDARVGLARIQKDDAGTPWYDGRPLDALGPIPVTDVTMLQDGTTATAGPSGLHLRTQHGDWRHTGAGLGGISPLTAVALSTDARHVYSAGTGLTGSPAVQASDDHGKTFLTSLVTNAPGTVTRIHVDPDDGTNALLVIARPNGEHDLWETTDGGHNWDSVFPASLPFPITGIERHGPSGMVLLATHAGLLARVQNTWLPLPSEGLTALATHDEHIVATGKHLHWQDALLETLPAILPVQRDSPVQADEIEIVDGTIWSLAGLLWSCPLDGPNCTPHEVPEGGIHTMAANASRVLLATDAGLYSSTPSASQ